MAPSAQHHLAVPMRSFLAASTLLILLPARSTCFSSSSFRRLSLPRHHPLGGGVPRRHPPFSSPSVVAPRLRARAVGGAVLRPLHSTTTTTTEEESEIVLNPLLSSIRLSKTVEIFSLVKQMQSEGIDVTSLCVGEPDFPPPRPVLDAIVRAVENVDTRYTAVTGTIELRTAIAHDLKVRKGVSYDPRNEIVVSNGAKQSVYQGILATCGVGDAVIVPSPYWPSYPEMVKLAGAAPVILETKESDGYLLDAESLKETLETHTNVKLLILCNPSNPTGGVHDLERLRSIAEVLEEFPDVAVLADEIYERLMYDNDNDGDGGTESSSCPCFASISPSMRSRTMTVNGFSKSHAMTGLRLGYLAAPRPLASAVTTIQSQLTSCAGSISQAAGLAALTEVAEEEMRQNVDIMRRKRDYVLDRLAKMEGIKLAVPPRGAFYVLPDVSDICDDDGDDDDTKLCLDLLKSKRLALVPGSSFGAPGTVRISYATGMEELETAMDKLEAFARERKA